MPGRDSQATVEERRSETQGVGSDGSDDRAKKFTCHSATLVQQEDSGHCWRTDCGDKGRSRESS